MHTCFLQLVLGCLAMKIHFVGIAAWSNRLKNHGWRVFKFVLLEQSLWIALFLEPVPNNLYGTTDESTRSKHFGMMEHFSCGLHLYWFSPSTAKHRLNLKIPSTYCHSEGPLYCFNWCYRGFRWCSQLYVPCANNMAHLSYFERCKNHQIYAFINNYSYQDAVYSPLYSCINVS